MTFDSTQYWEERYSHSGNSGDGSYGNLAHFKAETINKIIKDYRIKSLVDYGVGDGNQYSLLNAKNIEYYGIDVSPTVINKCREKFSDQSSKFMLVSDFINLDATFDLSMSCDVIYHLIEEDVYKSYLDYLFNLSHRYILIYARNQTKRHAEHVYFREFNDYFTKKYRCCLIKKILNKYPQNILGMNNDTTSPSDFFLYTK